MLLVVLFVQRVRLTFRGRIGVVYIIVKTLFTHSILPFSLSLLLLLSRASHSLRISPARITFYGCVMSFKYLSLHSRTITLVRVGRFTHRVSHFFPPLITFTTFNSFSPFSPFSHYLLHYIFNVHLTQTAERIIIPCDKRYSSYILSSYKKFVVSGVFKISCDLS